MARDKEKEAVSPFQFTAAERVWAEGDDAADGRVIFRRKFGFAEKESPPKSAPLYIVCASSYNLYVNGRLAVLGGLSFSAKPNLRRKITDRKSVV